MINESQVTTRVEVEQICLQTMREQLAEFAHFEQIKEELAKLYDGRSVVCPKSEEHARDMIIMGQFYLSQFHADTFNALTKDYNV